MLDLGDLPLHLRLIMRLVLRKVELSYAALREAVQDLPEGERLSPSELDNALQDLKTQGWLSTEERNGVMIYRAILGRKAKRNIDQNLWDALDSLQSSDSQSDTDAPPKTGSSRRSTDTFSRSLLDAFESDPKPDKFE